MPLSAATGLKLSGSNVIAIHVDGSYGSEHWYSGAGIYRHVWLERTPAVHVSDDGVFAAATLSAGYGSGSVSTTVELDNDSADDARRVRITATLYGPNGGTAAGTASEIVLKRLPAHSSRYVVKMDAISIAHPQLWGIRTPVLYTLVTQIESSGARNSIGAAGDGGGSSSSSGEEDKEEKAAKKTFSAVQTINTTVGFREYRWDYDTGKLPPLLLLLFSFSLGSSNYTTTYFFFIFNRLPLFFVSSLFLIFYV